MIATGTITMFYCPKCRRTYQEGTQRFCDNDGGRLLPAPSAQKIDPQSGGVFSNIIGKTQHARDAQKKSTDAPRFIPLNKTEESDIKLTSFPSAGRIFQSENFLSSKAEIEPDTDDPILELEPLDKIDAPLEFEPVLRNETETSGEDMQRRAPRLVKPDEIASGTASVGDRRTNPLGRKAFNWDNRDALLGQTVKGRYQIIEELEPDDEDSVIYLAEDKIVAGRRAIVRVFMDDDLSAGEANEKILAEERVSLSHLKHPNIAAVFDSGELPEGNEFIVSEFVEGKTIAAVLRESGEFNALRTARIIRQSAYALSEAHQNGILHRNLKPENIVLTLSESGIEQVKLMNFGVSHGDLTDENFPYKAPEEIERGISTYASDIYALAVIAFQMLTKRLPFPVESEKQLLKAQKAGLTLSPTELRADVQPLTDKILAKALAFAPSERYPKARDFGDSFFNALATVASWKVDETKNQEFGADQLEKQPEFDIAAPVAEKDSTDEQSLINADIHITPKNEAAEDAATAPEVKTSEPPAWEKHSPEPARTGASWRTWAAVIGVVALLLTVLALSRLFVNRTAQPENVQPPAMQPTAVVPVEKAQENLSTTLDGDAAPEPRAQTPPPGFQRFQNNRATLNDDLAKNFLGFEVFYPQDWTKAETPTNFLDISKRAANNFPVEQMIVTRYESGGTMTLDRANFPKLAEKSNQDLKKYFGESYKIVSEGDTSIQNGRWKVYEVRFQGAALDAKGETVRIWGRRFWLPVQRAGVPNGFVITLLASSLSETVKSVDDVGVRGELANVLETFEPEQFR